MSKIYTLSRTSFCIDFGAGSGAGFEGRRLRASVYLCKMSLTLKPIYYRQLGRFLQLLAGPDKCLLSAYKRSSNPQVARSSRAGRTIFSSTYKPHHFVNSFWCRFWYRFFSSVSPPLLSKNRVRDGHNVPSFSCRDAPKVSSLCTDPPQPLRDDWQMYGASHASENFRSWPS